MATMNPIGSKLALVTNRIKEKRINLNYTQEYVAGKLDISQNAYSKMESGLTEFSVKRLYQIAEVLETDVQHFIS